MKIGDVYFGRVFGYTCEDEGNSLRRVTETAQLQEIYPTKGFKSSVMVGWAILLYCLDTFSSSFVS